MKNNSGFSLVELMTVLVIIGITVSISMPSFLKWRQNQQLNTAARGVQSIIQSMRLQSLKESAVTQIQFNEPINDYVTTIFIRSENGPVNKIESYHLPAGIQFQKITFNKGLLQYNSRGLPAGGNGSVSLKNRCGTALRIVVPFTGNSRITSTSN